jgi:hypothetical protein
MLTMCGLRLMVFGELSRPQAAGAENRGGNSLPFIHASSPSSQEKLMRRVPFTPNFIAGPVLLMSLAWMPIGGHSQEPGDELTCVECQGLECVQVASHANACSTFVVPGYGLHCGASGGACGFEALSMTGQVVISVPLGPD